MVILPVYSVIVPENANTKSDDVPLKAAFVTIKVIVPVVPAFIAFNSGTLGALVIVILPVYSVTVPANASAKSEDGPLNAVVVVVSVIAPVVAAFIVFN